MRVLLLWDVTERGLVVIDVSEQSVASIFKGRAVYGIMWKSMVEPDRQQAYPLCMLED
jgi:hypothetical protein